MQCLPNLYKKNWYILSFLLMISIASLFLHSYGKSQSFIALNSYHPFVLNVFFINLTFMGDGIFAICLILLLRLVYKKNKINNGLGLVFFVFGDSCTGN